MYWETCHVTYDQAVEMFNAQTATQQAMGQNPIVSSTKVKRKQFSSVYEAQNEYSKTTIEKSKQFEESILQIQDSGNQSAKSLIERINNSYRPTSNGATDTEPTKAKKVGDDAVAKVHNRQDVVEDGVFVWIETIGTGHALLTVHDSDITMFSYGRYDDIYPNTLGTMGDGVLIKASNEDCKPYLREQIFAKGARVFKITDVNKSDVFNYLNDIWEDSDDYPDSTEGELTLKSGRVINEYSLFENNCTTTIVDSLDKSGTKIFEDSILGVELDQSFTIPVSLSDYLKDASLNFDMLVIDVTKEMKMFLDNPNNLKIKKPSKKDIVFGIITNQASFFGSSSSD